jgi:hypothetical protein
VDCIWRLSLLFYAICSYIDRFPKDAAKSTLDYTIAQIRENILPNLPSKLPKKRLREMTKLFHSTADKVRNILGNSQLASSSTLAQSTKWSQKPTPLPIDNVDTGRTSSINDFYVRDLVCVSRSMQEMSIWPQTELDPTLLVEDVVI